MTATQPTPDEARALLGRSTSVAAAIRSAGQNRHAQWLTGMATASFMYLVGMGIASTDAEVVVISMGFVAAVAALCLALLPTAPVAKIGMRRRWVWSLVIWGALFAAAMSVGLLGFRAEPVFWAPAALVVALPFAIGAAREGRA
jgi:cation transport ATPase